MNKELLIGLCIFFSILQGSVIPFFFDGISQPDLWLVFIIISAMVFPVKYAYVLSIVGGLVQDLIIGNFFGLHLLAYIVITFIFVKFVKGKYNRNWYVSVISVIVGSYSDFHIVFRLSYKQANPHSHALSLQLFSQTHRRFPD